MSPLLGNHHQPISSDPGPATITGHVRDILFAVVIGDPNRLGRFSGHVRLTARPIGPRRQHDNRAYANLIRSELRGTGFGRDHAKTCRARFCLAACLSVMRRGPRFDFDSYSASD